MTDRERLAEVEGRLRCRTCGRESSYDYCREHDPDPERVKERLKRSPGKRAHRARRRKRKHQEFTRRTGYGSRNSPTLDKLYAELGRHYRRLYTEDAA